MKETKDKKPKKIVENPMMKEVKQLKENIFKQLGSAEFIKELAALYKPKPFDRNNYEAAIKQQAQEYRAFVIEATIQVEAYFDEIIINYFCKIDRKSDFLNIVIQKDLFTLNQKLDIIKAIAKNTLGIDYIHKKFGKDYISILERFIEQRNKCAHIAFNASLFNLGEPTHFGDKLNDKKTNQISINIASDNILFVVSFVGSIKGWIMGMDNNKEQ